MQLRDASVACSARTDGALWICARALALVDGRRSVSRQRLRGLGVAPSTIGQAVRDGRLSRLARGIVRLRTRHRDLLEDAAPSWACCPIGRLPRCTASPSSGRAVPWTSRSMHRRRRAPSWAVLHRARLEPPDVDVVDGLGVTSVERTVRDLAGSLALHEAVVAMDSAARQGLVEVVASRPWLAAARGPGSARLRAVVDALGPRAATPRSRRCCGLTLAGAGFYPDTQVQIEGRGPRRLPVRGAAAGGGGRRVRLPRGSHRVPRGPPSRERPPGPRVPLAPLHLGGRRPCADAVVRTVRDVLARADP